MAHIFDPSTRKVKTGSDMAKKKKEVKAGGDRSSALPFTLAKDSEPFSLRIHGDRIFPYRPEDSVVVRSFSSGLFLYLYLSACTPISGSELLL